jgi:4-amino-4-deoxy-L-arabinose transferase-like glycosyltransferase
LVDPDEPFYSQTCHEMVESGDWLTPKIYGQPQFEKPILYYWLVSASYKVFGENEFAGRIPSALPATLAVLALYGFARQVFNRRTAFLSALILATGLEYCLMARLMLTDIALALLLALSMFSLWFAIQKQSGFWMFCQLLFGGLAVLMKGPIGTLIPMMGVGLFLWRTGKGLPWRSAGCLAGLGAWALIVLPWYGLMFKWYPRMFWEDFFVRDNWLRLIRAEHPANNVCFGLPYYIAILLLGSIPWMPMVAAALGRARQDVRRDERMLFLWSWILTSWVFLTIAQSKLPSYIFYLFIPLALVAGVSLERLLSEGFRSKGERIAVLVFGFLQFAGVLVAPLTKEAKPFLIPCLMVAGCLGVALVLLWRNQLRSWVWATTMATVVLLAGALTVNTPEVEALSSAKPLAREMLALRKGNEPLLASKFLVRGVRYYTHEPVMVLAGKSQPFWASHPLPVVVWKNDQFEEFVAKNQTALCAIRKSEWEILSKHQVFGAKDGFVQMGDNILVRAHPRAD